MKTPILAAAEKKIMTWSLQRPPKAYYRYENLERRHLAPLRLRDDSASDFLATIRSTRDGLTLF